MRRSWFWVAILPALSACTHGPSQADIDAQATQIAAQCDAIYGDPAFSTLRGFGVLENVGSQIDPPERVPTTEERRLLQQLGLRLPACRASWVRWAAQLGPNHAAIQGQAFQASAQNLDQLAAGDQTFAQYAATRARIATALDAGMAEADAHNKAAAQSAQAAAWQQFSIQMQQQQLHQQQMNALQNQRMQTTCTAVGNSMTCH